ncbi:replication protein A 70 kDa DNA-binding subunit [Danaus plexippus]|uniref:Replication protein A subunit n=1 Tax=Danaus plexippus plexippus TaxID=278856 RepID=A0A212EIA5_DANPL|nr:replication protein A 70 kDa DNA-binding subunit [Danaus plexippus]OWR41201.1 replication protein A1 [Danaus plexippus plexippus]
MSYSLSEGAVEIIMSGGEYDGPVIQVLGHKKIQSRGEDRIRLIVSDGKHSHSLALLNSQLNNKVFSGELSNYSVIKVDKYFISSVQKKEEKRVMVILNLTIIAPGAEVGKKLGDPIQWSEDMTSPSYASTTKAEPKPVPTPMSNLSKTTAGINLNSSVLSSQMTHPIASLSPYQNKWVIKARVMNKTAIRTWSNAKGEGKLFSMDLCDESGEIRATAFKNECDKFYDMIQIDKVYYISRCQLKTANKQYTTLKNDYEMTFTADTVVSECMEESNSVPSIKYDFMPISDIADKGPDTILDVIGVCKSASDIQELTAKSTGKLLKKREATLVDSSGGAITLTLWGAEAEKFDGSSNPVVAVKGARLAEFNGSKSLSCLASTIVRVQPDVEEAHRLRGWYDNGGDSMAMVHISARVGQGGGNAEWMTFAEAEERRLGTGDKADYFSLLGVLTFTFADNAVYKACPQEQCNKKLVDQQNGLYRCEKCNREYPNYKYRLLLGATVSDPTGDQRVTAFNESAEVMLGRSAEEVGRLSDYDKAEYGQLLDHVKFKTFVFKFRTKIETYSDEAKLKTVVMSAQPVDYRDANARLVKSIKALSGVEV